jgi:hypothetical protein
MKDNAFHIYDFIMDNGDEDGEIKLANKFTFQSDGSINKVIII